MAAAKKKTRQQKTDFTPNAEIVFEGGVPKELWVSITAKVSTRPYENIDVGGGLTMSITDPTTDLNKLRDDAFKWCSAWLMENVKKVRTKYEEKG